MRPRRRRRNSRAFFGSRRVTTRLALVARTRAPIAAICAELLPSPKITSGTPRRSARCWSTLAKPRSSKGRLRRRSSAAAVPTRPAATCSRSRRKRSSVIVNTLGSSPARRFGIQRPRRRDQDLAHRAGVGADHCEGGFACLELFTGPGNMTQTFDHEAADGSILAAFRQLQPEALVEFGHRRSCRHAERARTYHPHQFLAWAVLLFDFTHDLLEQILKGQNSRRSAILIDYH